MNKAKKVTLAAAVSFTALGLICFIVGAANVGFDYTKFSQQPEYETKTFESDSRCSSIYIQTISDDIKIEKSQDGKTKVVYSNSKDEKITYNISASDGLQIKQEDNRQWYDRISFFSFETSHPLTVYLPQESYDSIDMLSISGNINSSLSLNAKTKFNSASTSGDITLKNINCSDFSAVSTSGTVNLDNIGSEKNINANSVSGDISLKKCQTSSVIGNSVSGNVSVNDIKADAKTKLNTTSGNITIYNTDSPVINAQTVSGNISGKIGFPGTYHTDTLSGTVSVPASKGGRDYSFETISGNIIQRDTTGEPPDPK